ncbi:hypothetical protein SARC_16026, partial [Sphaeroforma arctica JP610]
MNSNRSRYRTILNSTVLDYYIVFDTDMHVWDAITEVRAKEYTSMQVWDSISAGSIEFSAKQVGYPYLGTLVENDLVQSALLDQIKQYSHVTTEYNSRVESFDW